MLKQNTMKRLLIVLMLMVAIEPFASSQHTSLMLTYQGNGVTAGIGTQAQQIPLLKNEMVERISNGYLPIVIEGDKQIAWIYLNTIDDPRGYEGEDFDEIQTEYIELSMDLFPIKINRKLRRKLQRGYDKFFETIGVEYFIGENDEVISKIDYDKFEKFI